MPHGLGVRSKAGVVIVTSLFLVSFGASAGATALVTSSGNTGERAASSTPSATARPTTSPTAAPTPGPTPSATVVPSPEPSPSVATKKQVKSATADLCDAIVANLPVLSTARADETWARIFEIHLFKQEINPGPIDGRFDVATAKGTKELQRALGVAETGKVGDATWGALWNDQCYVPPTVVPDSSWSSGDGTSGGGSSGGGSSGGGGTLDRVE